MSATALTQATVLLTQPFVRSGIYASPEQALKHIVLDYIDRQLAWAQAERRRYERKYHCAFAEWSKSLSGKATIADEDDWMEWEAILDMLDSWQKIKTEAHQSSV